MVGIHRAKELSLTGNFLSAEQAQQWGLVNRVVAPEDLMPQARALALDMLSVIPAMLVSYKKVIDNGYALPFGEGLALERERARAANVSVSAEEIERRREAVRARAHDRRRSDIGTDTNGGRRGDGHGKTRRQGCGDHRRRQRDR